MVSGGIIGILLPQKLVKYIRVIFMNLCNITNNFLIFSDLNYPIKAQYYYEFKHLHAFSN